MSEKTDKPSFAERMLAVSEKMENAGQATSKAGGGITCFVIALIIVLVIGFLLWSVAC